jgi:hypothetical protein
VLEADPAAVYASGHVLFVREETLLAQERLREPRARPCSSRPSADLPAFPGFFDFSAFLAIMSLFGSSWLFT